MKNFLSLLLLLALFSCKNVKSTDTDGEDHQKTEDMKSADKDWEMLFDGTSMDNWRGFLSDKMPAEWSITDAGELHFNPVEGYAKHGAQDIISDKTYGSFELSVDWKISPKGNSGIFWGVIEDDKYSHPYLTGPEIQVLDDAEHPDSFVAEGTHKAGALYDFAAPLDTTAVKPAGQWNTCVVKIDHEANLGQAWLNGTKTAEFPLHGEAFTTLKANSKFKDMEDFAHNNPGHLSLQDHGDKVWFKNIKIREF